MDVPPLLKHTDLLHQRLPFSSARVADVACGDGAEVRVMARAGARASQALRSAADGGALEEAAEVFYRAPLRLKSPEAFLEGHVAVDPARRIAVDAAAASLRQGFLAAAEQRDGGFWFEIPSRLNLLRRH